MRWLSAPALSLLSCVSYYSLLAAADAVDPPGLAPLITRGNVLLSSGHFADAAKAYSDAIEQSPNDYLLYYKRATAYLSLQRHASALEDLDKVLSLTGNSMDGALISKARVFAKEGEFEQAKDALTSYVKAKGGVADAQAQELQAEIIEADRLYHKADRERRAQLWPACVESTSAALRVASHSIQLRTWRAECALADGDIESSVADLTRLGNLMNPSTNLLVRIFRLSYFLSPPSPAALNTLKQCFHFDPDSKLCHKLHKLAKAFDKSFTKLDNLLERKDWRAVTKLLLTGDDRKAGDLWRRWEEALLENTGRTENVFPLVPQALASSSSVSEPAPETSSRKKAKQASEPNIPLPLATKISPQRQKLVRSLCQAYIHLADNAPSSKDYKSQMDKWCEELLTLKDCQEDVWGLVGRGESLLAKEEYEDALRTFERAFEASGRSDGGIQKRYTKAQRLLKQSKQKDYYKILGVSRDADAKTIKKAFRKAAKAAHPDKGGSEEKMAALNEAYEVLSNPETRQRFDNGEDPNDPSGGQPHYGFYPGGGFGGAGGNPFANFFQQGGGGFQFTQSHGHGGQRAGGGGPFQFHFGH